MTLHINTENLNTGGTSLCSSISNRLAPPKKLKNKNNPSGLVAGWRNSQVQHMENDHRSTRDTNYRQQHETKGTLQHYQFS